MVGCPIIGIQDSGGARIQDAVTSLAWSPSWAAATKRCPGWCRRSPSSSANALGSGVFADQDDLLVSVRDQGYFSSRDRM